MRGRARALLALAAALGGVAVMVRLADWQWDRARATGRFLNYTYTVEWLLFAALTVLGLVRLGVEDHRIRNAGEPRERVGAGWSASPAAPQIGPPLRPGEELEEITWIRLRRRLGLGGNRP